MSVEVTIIARWDEDYEPDEDEVRDIIEGQWLGTLVLYETEEV